MTELKLDTKFPDMTRVFATGKTPWVKLHRSDDFGGTARDAEREGRLFAAAPELLQLVMDAVETPDEFETDWNRLARAAIAKALGTPTE